MNAMTPPERLAVAAHDSEDFNTSDNPSLNDIVDARLSRRGMLRVSMGTAGAALMGTVGLTACGGGDGDDGPVAGGSTSQPLSLNFNAVAKSTADTVAVPPGYTATPIYALGDPLTAATPDYKNDGSDTDFDKRAGDHHDGIEYFGLNAAGTARDVAGSERGLLAMNHEALTDQFLHVAGVTPAVAASGSTPAVGRPAGEADKEIAAHGISIVEVRKVNGRFQYDKASRYNRRLTPLTPMSLSGPVRGNVLLQTKFSPTGVETRGTINNCGASYTPWGTYFSGEENWNGYFARSGTDDAARTSASDAKSVVSLARYGRAQGTTGRHRWETVNGGAAPYDRWNISVTGASATDDFRNELNTYGYMVEVDPYDPASMPRKRTALGRFAHEMGTFAPPQVGKPLAVYLGDDSQGEYIYKFVSAANWSAADANPANRITTGDKYLDSGKLYVAKFNGDGTGQWIELVITNPQIAGFSRYTFADQADVLVNARLAADAVGATKMDRPEWSAVNPRNGEIYVTLTNNANRKVEPTGSQTAVDAANPRAYVDPVTPPNSSGSTAPSAPGNINGHIVRMKESGNEPAAITFTWDIYLFGAEAGSNANLVNLSGLTAENDLSSPDGLWFSQKTGLLYVQTDDGAYTDVTNCMLLVARPGQVGDGATQTLEYTKADGSKLTVTTRVGAKPTAATLRRFLVGPKDCEITGITETPDGKALFINVQHPGDNISRANVTDPTKYSGHWPGNAGYGAGGALARPRSATVVITRNDGGVIGADGNEFLNNY